jgi:hypothetical protein
MPQIRTSLVILVLLVAPAAAAGCGGSNIGGGTDTEAPAVPKDRFTRQVSAAEAKQMGAPYGAPGAWNLTIGNGVYTLGGPSQTFGGSTKVSSGGISFGPPAIPQLNRPGLSDAQRALIKNSLRTTLAPCGTAVGNYRHSEHGRTEAFKAVKDACTARRVALSGAWTRGR